MTPEFESKARDFVNFVLRHTYPARAGTHGPETVHSLIKYHPFAKEFAMLESAMENKTLEELKSVDGHASQGAPDPTPDSATSLARIADILDTRWGRKPDTASVPEASVILGDAAPGLYLFNGTLIMKTEYWTVVPGARKPDCYIVESGEYFCGAPDAELRYLLVTPVKINLP